VKGCEESKVHLETEGRVMEVSAEQLACAPDPVPECVPVAGHGCRCSGNISMRVEPRQQCAREVGVADDQASDGIGPYLVKVVEGFGDQSDEQA
jgi:hypothetical protein